MGFLDNLKNLASGSGIGDTLAKLGRDKDLLEGCMAAGTMVAAADGTIDTKERDKIGLFVKTHPMMKHFDQMQAAQLFSRYSEAYAFSEDMGDTAMLKEIGQVQGDEKRVLVVQLALAVARSSSGEEGATKKIDDTERAKIVKIINLYRFSVNDFNLN